MTNPEIQYKANLYYALRMRVINLFQYLSLIEPVSSCQNQTRYCGNNIKISNPFSPHEIFTSSLHHFTEATNSSSACIKALEICNGVFRKITASKPGINVITFLILPIFMHEKLKTETDQFYIYIYIYIHYKFQYYDIRKKCMGSLCYDFSNVERFLNEEAVQTALGVVGGIRFVSCSSVVYSRMAANVMKSYDAGIPALLEDGIEVLIYAGEYDLICNWIGNSRWVKKMKWSGQKRFGSARKRPFKVGGAEVGWRKSYGGLSLMKVYDAGHMVPMDQPKASFEMLRRWMQGYFFETPQILLDV